MTRKRLSTFIDSLAAGLLVLAASACQTAQFKAVAPEGFAVAKASRSKADGTVLESVSYSGVTYRVRTQRNEPKADLKFWQESLTTHLTDAGYIASGTAPLTADGEKGTLLTFVAPTSSADYRFNVALFVRDREIVIAEAAGEQAEYKKFDPAIRAAIDAIQFGH